MWLEKLYPPQYCLLTHCILVDCSSVICWTSPFLILGVSGLFHHVYSIFDGKSCLKANHHVASAQGLHCLPMTLLQVSWQEWVKDLRTYYIKL